MYASRWGLFTGIGFLTVPVALLVTGLQVLILATPDVAGVSASGEDLGLRVALAGVATVLVAGTGIVLVIAATTHALGEIDRGAQVGVRGAYRLALTRWRSLLGAFLVSAAVVGVLAVTVVLSLVALVLAVLFALFVPVITYDGLPAVRALRRSASLVRHRVVKTAALLAASIVLAGIVGPVFGTVLILVTGAPFAVVNIVAGITFALLMPYVGLMVGYLYFDAEVRDRLAHQAVDRPVVLPAET
jgi:hypothetical protein